MNLLEMVGKQKSPHRVVETQWGLVEQSIQLLIWNQMRCAGTAWPRRQRGTQCGRPNQPRLKRAGSSLEICHSFLHRELCDWGQATGDIGCPGTTPHYFFFLVVLVSISPSHKNRLGARKLGRGVWLVSVSRGMTAPATGERPGDNRMGVVTVGIARSGQVGDRPVFRRYEGSMLGKRKKPRQVMVTQRGQYYVTVPNLDRHPAG